MPLLLYKRYDEAADATAARMKNVVRTEKEREITLEGDFEVFSLADMDMWGGHIRFAFHDQEAKDDEERRERGEIAMLNPQLAYMFTAQSTMRVYRQRTVRTEIRKYVGSRMISETCEDVEEWEDVTKEFERIAMRETALGR